MRPDNFFAELKRRNVYKVAVAYVVVAWLVIQAASILLPTFDAPSWAMKVYRSITRPRLSRSPRFVLGV